MFQRHAFILALIFALGFGFYSNGLSGGFMVDDHAFFDDTMNHPRFLLSHFIPDREQAMDIADSGPRAYYRPLAHIVPMLARLAFGNYVPAYHVFNLILHGLAAFLLFLLILRLFSSVPLAGVTALFWLVHPVNGLQVNYITASVFSVQMIGMTLGLWSLAGLLRNPRPAPLRAAGYWAGAGLGAVVGLLCHETAMAFPFYAAAMIYVSLPGPFTLRARRTIWLSLPFMVLILVYFLFRLRFASLDRSILGNFARFDMNIVEYAASVAKLITWYLGKLFVPRGIVLTYAMPVVRSHLAGWLLLLAALAGVWGILIHRFRRDSPVILGFFWLGIGFLPFLFATVFQPVHGLWMEPHWFVFSCSGFFLAAARLIMAITLGRQIRGIPVYMIAAGVVILLWGFTSRLYNRLWADEVVYCEYWLEESPGFNGARMSLAKAHELRKNYTLARPLYQAVIRDGFRLPVAYTNLGLMDLLEGRWEQAKENLEKALALSPHSSITLTNLGVIAFKDSDLNLAEDFFRRAINDNRFLVLPRLNLAKVMLARNRRADAIRELEAILQFNPAHEIVLMELLQIHVQDQNLAGIRETAARPLKVTRDPRIARLALEAMSYPARLISDRPHPVETEAPVSP